MLIEWTSFNNSKNYSTSLFYDHAFIGNLFSSKMSLFYFGIVYSSTITTNTTLTLSKVFHQSGINEFFKIFRFFFFPGNMLQFKNV